MGFLKYTALEQEDLGSEENALPSSSSLSVFLSSRATITLFRLLVFTSISINAVSVYRYLRTRSNDDVGAATEYAGLLKDVAIPFTIDAVYTSNNRTIQDEAWNSPHLIPYTGLVAVTDDWARSKNLPLAQRFPWDETKGLYVLNGFHDLHCLHRLRRSSLEAFDNIPQSMSREHITHCLNVLREAIMCNADDTPRYTGRLNQQASAEHPKSGIGQTRMCKDWTLLRQWALEHSACYKPINMSTPGFPPRERYKFCPNGEKFWL